MTQPAGRWASVTLPGGGVRQDWVPVEQPPSPDGSAGDWHVVVLAGGQNTWEWHPAGEAHLVVARNATAVISFDGRVVTIATGKRGREHAIPLAAIISLEWKPARAVGTGWLLLRCHGSQTRAIEGSTSGADHPRLRFPRARQAEFEVLRGAIQSAIARRG